MPRPGIDNFQVHRSIFQDFAKTQEFELSADPVREAVLLYLQGLDWLEQQEQQKEMAKQAMAAQQMGMANAARGPSTGAPSTPSTQVDPNAPVG